MKRVLLLLGMMFSLTAVLAEENVLQTIEIEPVKDTYNIVLVSDKVVDVKKTVEDSNRITLTMKNIRASKTLNTVYNNVSNVDTVMVEPSGNGISIFFQAENAAKATVSFDALNAPIPMASTTKNLKLNNPIESYAPIYTEDYKTEKTSSMFDRLKASSTVAIMKDSVKEGVAGGAETANKFIGFGLVTLLLVAVSRLFKRKEPEMKIGLSQSLTNREIDLYKGVQNPIQSTPQPSFSTVSYGLNAYQRENRNPYETQPVQFHNPRMNSYASAPTYVEPIAQPQVRPMAQTATVQAPARKMTTPVNTAPVNQSNPNVDNLKFLESMTAIYEKSGRHDLARGLKASLNKNNLK